MPEQIGLQSVLDNEQFLAALAEYNAAVKKTDAVNDNLAASYKSVDKAEAGLTDQTKKTSTTQEKQGGVAKSLYGKYTELSSGLSIVKQGMAAVGQVIDATIGSFMRQAQEVRSLSLATGAGYEETSRLIQVFDDAGVDAGRLRAAMLALKNQGIAPSIDSIAKLADEYRAIQDPNEKVMFLTKNLGSRGVELGKIFDMTGKQIRQAGKEVSDSLVFDEKKIALAEQARIAQDELNDTLTGYSNEIALFVLPGVMNFIGGLKLLTEAVNENNESLKDSGDSGIAVADVYKRMATHGETYAIALRALKKEQKDIVETQYAADIAYAKTAQTTKGYQRAMEGATEETENLSDVTLDLSAAGRYQRDMFVKLYDVTASYEAEARRLAGVQTALAAGISGPLKSAYTSYSNTMDTVSEKQAVLALQIDTMLKQGYSPTGKAIMELKAEYDGLNGEMLSAEEAFKKTTAQMIYQQAAAGLDADAALDLARAMGLVSESDYNLATAIGVLKEKYADRGDQESYIAGVMALNEAALDGKVTLEEVNRIMDLLDGKVSNATINVTEQHWIPPPIYAPKPKGRATGGNVLAGQPSWMGEYRPEVMIPRYATGGSPAGAMPAMVGERGPEIIIPKTDSYVYPSTNSYYQNYSNQMNMSMSGINVSNGMDLAALKAMIMQTVSEALSMRS